MARTSSSRSRSRSKACNCDRLRDLCCDFKTQKCAPSFLIIFLLVLAALAAVAASVLFLLRFAVTPQVKAYVEDARLNTFVFANRSVNHLKKNRSGSAAATKSYQYNISISVALTVRNPNGAMYIWYAKPLVATFLFHDRLLYNVTVVDEGHGQRWHKREDHLLHTGGEGPYALDTAAVKEFKKQNAKGLFKVEMRLSGEISLGIRNKRGLELSCPLTLQRPPPGPDVVVFHEVECKPDKPKNIVF